ncbi:uncharacterized protein LOC112272376 isoform X2 [Brachypodium distachyon]|uniref:uncharacterized protein LOC112272376 isoform X2 n=1 Tax=Brachypodium distachyon TaxID=15368 RepID=UPI000D0DCAC3|nr:uncharacterized protein LOC112272376 isoform X2 [Brachypodium distachyon]|eukprot:XP_024318762.1 uncharacterized protein LOC112272376 isoform X2 [Brachypodium distachyon]
MASRRTASGWISSPAYRITMVGLYLFKQSSPEEKARMREEFVRREDDTPAEKREVDSDDEDGIENLANEILSLLYQGIWKQINGDQAYCPFCNRKVNPDFLSVLQHTESYRPEPPNAGGKKGTHRGLKCFLRANVPPHLEAMMTARTEKLGMWYEP